MAQVQQNIETWKSKLDKALHEKNTFTDILEKIEKKTNVRRLYIVLGFVAFLALYLMIGYGAQFLCNFLGFLYPAYASVKAIESKEKDDDTKWLTYWVVYSLFSLLEFFTDIFLFWIPFYWFLKCIFLVYCMVPTSFNGSLTIYYRVIRPLFLKYQTKVDAALDTAADAAQGVINEVFRALRFKHLSQYQIQETSMSNDTPSPGTEQAAKDAAAEAITRHYTDSSKTD